jgi:hypothetical protein
VAVLTGFGDSRATSESKNNVVEFGWVIDPPDGASAVQRSQMALVSVPSWAGEIVFDITTGWLDGDSGETYGLEEYSVHVPLPPDFEALDVVVWGGSLDKRRKPEIWEEFMDPEDGELRLPACTDASILIRGKRLWRSATATLGGQHARRIRIMPSMDGIIAEFDALAPPPTGSGEERRVLRVWTSEGMATSRKPIDVIAPAGGVCPAAAAE